MSLRAPADLVLVAHGTRDPAGPPVVRDLVALVRGLRPELRVVEAYVELVSPVLSVALAAGTGPAVCVPLLLSRGHHVAHDLPTALADSGRPGVVAPPLGPDPVLVQLLQRRLVEAGAEPHQPVVLAAAGSSYAAGRSDVGATAAALATLRGAPVRVGYATGGGNRVAHAVAGLRRRTGLNPAVATFLIAPGRFASAVRRDALAAGATAVGDVLGADLALAELALARYDADCPTRDSSDRLAPEIGRAWCQAI